jgi:hypothetical protein
MSQRVAYAAGLIGLYAAGVIVAALALYGCGSEPDATYAQAVGFVCTNSDSATADRICHNRPAGRGVEHVSRYCYKTLADSNCFDRPDHDRKNQALGSSGY